jgi:hypothetical protein
MSARGRRMVSNCAPNSADTARSWLRDGSRTQRSPYSVSSTRKRFILMVAQAPRLRRSGSRVLGGAPKGWEAEAADLLFLIVLVVNSGKSGCRVGIDAIGLADPPGRHYPSSRRKRGGSSVGRAVALQATGHRFDPGPLHTQVTTHGAPWFQGAPATCPGGPAGGAETSRSERAVRVAAGSPAP